MGISRYRETQLVSNNREEYDEMFNKRNIGEITHFSFANFKELRMEDLSNVQIETYIWESSSRFYKLAHAYYGDPTYWWVIALFNNTPLETNITMGQKILIPVPIEAIISALEM